MNKNSNLHKAKEKKNDEFYTQLSDIENELRHYKQYFRGKVVYCNCDDPFWSNFWKYFHSNFSSLGLKKLISTHYQRNSEPSYAMIYEGGNDFDIDDGKIIEIKGNTSVVNGKEIYYTAGDFRSNACIKLMEEATIISTNPPFSLFNPYIKCLVDSGKKFIILGKQSKVNNKDIFPLFKNNKIWYGASIHSGGVDFRMPDDYDEYGDNVFIKNGHHYINLDGIRWFTNMDVKYRHDGLWHKNGKFDYSQAHCYYEGNETAYPHYYNFDGIDIDSTNNIPIDYPGYMGVPINILDRFNPDELEIIGTGSDVEKTMVHTVTEAKKTIAYVKPDGSIAWSTPYTVSERKLGNGLRIKGPDGNPATSPFSRIIIRNRNPISKSEDKGY